MLERNVSCRDITYFRSRGNHWLWELAVSPRIFSQAHTLRSEISTVLFNRILTRTIQWATSYEWKHQTIFNTLAIFSILLNAPDHNQLPTFISRYASDHRQCRSTFYQQTLQQGNSYGRKGIAFMNRDQDDIHYYASHCGKILADSDCGWATTISTSSVHTYAVIVKSRSAAHRWDRAGHSPDKNWESVVAMLLFTRAQSSSEDIQEIYCVAKDIKRVAKQLQRPPLKSQDWRSHLKRDHHSATFPFSSCIFLRLIAYSWSGGSLYQAACSNNQCWPTIPLRHLCTIPAVISH